MHVLAEDAVALLDHLQVDRAHIVGNSMGGAIAQELAINAPQRVTTLSLHSTWAKGDAFLGLLLETWKALRATVPPEVYWQEQLLWVLPPAFLNAQQQELRESVRAATLANPYPMSSEAFASRTDACLQHDTEDRLTQITAPTLITVGAEDLIVGRFAERLRRGICTSEMVVFEGLGHGPCLENPDEFNRVTLDFLRRHPFGAK
jgi:pimeloyl-ACP methyl ester carboxylesterase